MPEGIAFTKIAAGYRFSLAIGSDGQIYAWGEGVVPVDENSGFGESHLPIRLPSPAGVTFTDISAGPGHSLAIGSDGKTYAWGRNWGGVLGTGNDQDTGVPTEVILPEGVKFVQVEAGNEYSLAIAEDGDTYHWGYTKRVPGRSDGSEYVLPEKVLTPPGVQFTSISLPPTSAGSPVNAAAIGTDSKVYTWGFNYPGQEDEVEGESGFSQYPTPAPLPPGLTLTQVSAGAGYTVGTDASGTVYSWGDNTYGNLGDGTSEFRTSPVTLQPEITVTEGTFGEVPGTDLTVNDDGTLSVVAPEHAPGPVDVAVAWKLVNTAQSPVLYSNGFTYLPPNEAPTITNLMDQTVELGQEAQFSVTVTGVPTPDVRWEVSTDAGVTWESVGSDTSAEVSTDKHSLAVAAAGIALLGVRKLRKA